MIPGFKGVHVKNAVQMLRESGDSRAMVLLEGSEDADALVPLLATARTNPHVCGGKKNALQAIALLNADGVTGTVAIVDRDFDGLISPVTTEPNVVYTDDADLDVTVLFSGNVLDRLARNWSDDGRRSLDLSRSGESLADRLIELAHPVGVLRKWSVASRAELALKEFPVNAVIGSDGRTVDIAQMCAIAKAASPNCQASVSDLEAAWQAEFPLPSPKRRYLRGHDLPSTLMRLFKIWGGGLPGTVKDVERMIRGSFGKSDLMTTRLYSELEQWGQLNGHTVWN